MVYHSSFVDDEGITKACGCPLLPLKSHIKGPAPVSDQGGTKAIINLGLEDVPVPGESGFPFAGLFPLPQSDEEAELFRNYLKQIREETSGRLLGVAYRPNGTPNKWWIAFAKRKFMNITVPQH
ncbi:hypothetical protein MKX01_010585 [Papaver californicum]|nr:hypothetical protein MKX01_010585 [Papaver californicum]